MSIGWVVRAVMTSKRLSLAAVCKGVSPCGIYIYYTGWIVSRVLVEYEGRVRRVCQ